MKFEEVIEALKGLYIFNPLNLDRTVQVNRSLDTVIDLLKEEQKRDEQNSTF